MGLDHLDQLLDHVDGGRFEHPLPDLPASVLARKAELGRAGGGGLDEEVVADGAQARRIDEACHGQLAEQRRRGIAGGERAHRAVGRDGDRLRACGHLQGRLQGIALRGDQRAVV